LIFVLPFPLSLFFIAWGIIFHSLNAWIMGLNLFPWSFWATYPALIYISTHITRQV
jgi:hypothetical protein